MEAEAVFHFIIYYLLWFRFAFIILKLTKVTMIVGNTVTCFLILLLFKTKSMDAWIVVTDLQLIFAKSSRVA